MNSPTGFLYLNLENLWPLVQPIGLVIDSQGALTLARVPRANSPVSLDMNPQAGVAGVTSDEEGNLYVSDPAENRVLRLDPHLPERVLYLGEQGSLPGQFRSPRGLVIGPPEALYVADSGNHRIQVFDRHTLQLRGVWGQPDPYAEPQPSIADGRFNEPWDLAFDSACYLYIVEHGNGRIQKFDWQGQVDPSFWDTLSQSKTLSEPTHITVWHGNGRKGGVQDEHEDQIYVVDRARREVVILRPTGEFLKAWGHEILGEPSGILILGDAVYVGDNQRKRVLKFLIRDGSFVGEAHNYEGPVAGLAVDSKGNIVVHPGQGQKVIYLKPDAAYVPHGSFLAGRLETEEIASLWHRVRVDAVPLPENTHLQLFAYTTDLPAAPPHEPGVENPFSHQAWRPIPRDVLDALLPSTPAEDVPTLASLPATGLLPSTGMTSTTILSEPRRFLWLGGLLQSDGNHSPAIQQIRIDFGRDTYLRYLPAIYAQKSEGRDFLERFLALFESVLGDLEEGIDVRLPKLFDPWSTPERFLPWLAGWLAFDLDEDWSISQKRQRIAEAFELQSMRGTAEGLRRYLKLYAEVDAFIEEPSLQSSLWSLGEESVLGFNTMLAPVYADGAILGISATLDQSNLSEEEEYGAPLFEATAFRFSVQVHRSELSGLTSLDEVRAIIEREKPAHTDYHLCVIEPRMRVGFQARVGIDTLVGGRQPELELDGQAMLGFARSASPKETVRQTGGSLGQDARIGKKTTLT
jgi:phage tail-like protein